MAEPDAWPAQAYLDAIRPPAGWRVSMALLATFSAELHAVVAALLALAGQDDDRGSGSRVDLAETVERLRGRVAILFQGGRLTGPRVRPAITGILDQFLVGIPCDMRQRSWHPKIALVRMTGGDGHEAWRLWVGSRNLTRSENLEFGLLLAGSAGGRAKGRAIPGIPDLGRELAERAGLPGLRPDVLQRELEGVRWIEPAGVRVADLRLLTGDGTAAFPLPRDADEVTIVSPFLHPNIVRAAGDWGGKGCRRRILSTMPELAKLAQAPGHVLQQWDQILVLDGPVLIPPDAEHEPEDVEQGAESLDLGLHAKLLVARRGSRLTMWVGSANATERAWRGWNAEVVARVEASASLESGLNALLGRARPVTTEELSLLPAEPQDEAEDRLEVARAYVAAHWSGRLSHAGDVFELRCEGPPHPPDPGIRLWAGPMTGALHEWQRNFPNLVFGPLAPAEQSGLVELALRFGGQQVSWLQGCIVDPPLGEERDRAALAAYLGAGAFLAWLRSLLVSSPVDRAEGDCWDGARRAAAAGEGASDPFPDLSVEEIMSSWARDPKAFGRADSRMREYLEEVVRRAAPADAAVVARLRRLGKVWSALRSELL